MAKNGLTKILISVGLTLALSLIGYVVANDVNARDRDTKITEELRDGDVEIKDKLAEAMMAQSEMNGKLNGSIIGLDKSVQFLGEQVQELKERL